MYEIHIQPFRIVTGSLERQLIDLKCKALWSGKFTDFEKQVGRVGGPEMYVRNATKVKEMPRVETLKFDAWNSQSSRLLQRGEEAGISSADYFRIDIFMRASGFLLEYY